MKRRRRSAERVSASERFMDACSAAAASSFLEQVQAIVEPVLLNLGLALQSFDDSPDEGGRYQYVAYYRSDDCKIQVYQSGREGETNCMIAPLDAPDAFGLRADKWQPLTRFSPRSQPPSAEQVALAIAEYNSYANPLEWVRDRIARYFEAAHTGILEMYPTPGRHSEAGSDELQLAIDRLSERLGVPSMPVGLRTNDGLNVYIADGTYHFAFYERGAIAFDQAGSLDDLLYWYCEGVVTRKAAKLVGDRQERFEYEYQVLSQFDVAWAKRRVRELAATFANGQPEDIALLPDIGEDL